MSGHSAAEFTETLTSKYRDEMEALLNEFFTEAHLDSFETTADVIRHYLPGTAWRELFIGCLPPARQINQVYERGDPYYDDRDLIIGLNKQIRDEMKHAKIATNVYNRFDDDGLDLTTWTPDHYEGLVEHCRSAVEWDEPHYIAAGFQCSTEIFASLKNRRLAEYVAPEYPNVAAVLADISSDEGDHVHVGRMLIKRFATPGDFERMEDIAAEKHRAIRSAYEQEANGGSR